MVGQTFRVLMAPVGPTHKDRCECSTSEGTDCGKLAIANSLVVRYTGFSVIYVTQRLKRPTFVAKV
jgi:hypothetical protein